jgi:hypothetical protein
MYISMVMACLKISYLEYDCERKMPLQAVTWSYLQKGHKIHTVNIYLIECLENFLTKDREHGNT